MQRTTKKWLDKIGDPKLLEEFKDVLDNIVAGNYNPKHLKPSVTDRRILKLKLDYQPRLLLTSVEVSPGKKFLVPLESLPTHDYHRSKFLNDESALGKELEKLKPLMQEQIKRYFTTINAAVVAPEIKDYKVSKFHSFGDLLIENNRDQELFRQAIMPIFLRGVPGSGKTWQMLDYGKELLERDSSPELCGLVLTKHLYLISSHKRLWKLNEKQEDEPEVEKQEDEEQGDEPKDTRIAFRHWADEIREQDPSLKDVPFVGFQHFVSFMTAYAKKYLGQCKAKKITPLDDKFLYDFDMLYLEFKLIAADPSGYKAGTNKGHFKDPKQCQYCMGAFEEYMKELIQKDPVTKKFKQFNPEFQSFDISKSYDFVFVDEFTEFTRFELAMILKLNKHGQFIIAGDQGQNETEIKSQGPFIIEQFREMKFPLTMITFSDSERCAPIITKAIMATDKLYKNLLNGVTDESEKTQIKVADSQRARQDQGTYIWAESFADENVKKTLTRLKGKKFNVVIPTDKYKDEVVKACPSATILTDGEVKGLDYDHVIAYLPFIKDAELAKQANTDFNPETAGKQLNFPKEDTGNDKYARFMRRLRVMFSRPKETLIIIQPVGKDNKKIYDFYMKEVGEQIPAEEHKAVVDTYVETKEEFENEIRRLLQSGNEPEAFRLWKERGNMPRDFVTFKQRVFKPKTERKQTSSSSSSSISTMSTPTTTKVSTSSSAKADSVTNANANNKGKQPQTPKSTIVPQPSTNAISTPINIIPQAKEMLNEQTKEMLNEMSQASENGKLNKINQLHQQNPDLINMQENGWSAIHRAASSGQEKAIESLINKGANINALANKPQGLDGASPLLLCIDSNKPNAFSCAKTLIKNKANVKIRIEHGLQAIHRAAWLGKKDIIQALCEAHPELIEQFDDRELTPLYWATAKGHVEICEYLLSKGASPIVFCNDPEVPEWHGKSTLDQAITEGHFSIAKMLIAKIDDLNFLKYSFVYALQSKNKELIEVFLKKNRKYFLNANLDGHSPLTIVASSGDVESAKYLIQQGADVNFTVNASSTPHHGKTALAIAIELGHADIALELINAPNIDLLASCHPSEFFPIHLACRRLDLLKAIIKKTPEALLQKTLIGQNILYYGSLSQNKEIIDYLIEEIEKKIVLVGINNNTAPQERDEFVLSIAFIREEWQTIIEFIEKNILTTDVVMSLLYFSIRLKRHDILEALYLKHPQLLHAKMLNGQTILHAAAASGWVEGINYFLAKNLDVNAAINFPNQSFNGNTPLDESIFNNQIDAALVLIKHGANLLTPYCEFHRAIKKRRKELLKPMLQANPDLINHLNEYGETPLHVAAETGDKEIVDFLIQKGAKINATINKPGYVTDGRTPIFSAIAANSTEVTKLLINAGADLNHFCKGYTPVHFAVVRGNLEIVQAILEKDIRTLSQKDAEGKTLLIAAIRSKKILLYIINKIIKENTAKYPKMLELLEAIIEGKTRAAIRLIENGTNINFTISGIQPIHLAAFFGRLAIVQAMVSKDQKLLNAKDMFNETPLIFALLNSRKPMFEYLVHEKADLDVRIDAPGNKQNLKTALIKAIDNAMCHFISILIKSGASTVIKIAEREYNVIHVAAIVGKLEAFNTITNLNPELLTKPDSMGQTSLFWASVNRRTEIVDFLISKGIQLSEAEKNKLALLTSLSLTRLSFHPIPKLNPGTALVNVVIYGADVSTLEPYKEELSKGELKEHCQKLLSKDVLEFLKVESLETQECDKAEEVKTQEESEPEEVRAKELEKIEDVKPQEKSKPDEVLSFGLLERKQKEAKPLVSQDDREQQAAKPLVIQEELDMQPETSQRVRR